MWACVCVRVCGHVCVCVCVMSGSDVVLTAMMGDHVRLLSFSSASSPQAPVLTASNGQCMLPRAVVLHSEACFARQRRPREENSTPRNGPHGGTTNRHGTHLTLSSSGRAWNFLWHSRSPAAHYLRYGATFFPNSTWCALNGANIITVQSSNKRWLAVA